MNGLSSAIWGGLGGFSVEAVQIYGATLRAKRPPWRRSGTDIAADSVQEPLDPTLEALVLSIVIRIVVGTILAAAAGESGQVSGALGAMAVGVAAPLVIQQMAREIPVSTSVPEPAGPVTTDPAATPGEAGADA